MSQSFKRVRRVVLGGIFIGLTALSVGSTSAGTINSTPTPVASGTGLGFVNVPAIVTVTPNNDDVPGTQPDTNLVVPLKRFDSIGYIDIPFTVSSSQGVTEYLFTEFVDNNTGTNWASFTMSLGFGTGASFTQVGGIGDGLDFDTGPPGGNTTPPTSVAFPTVARPDEDTLVFSGAIHGSGAQQYQFRVDVSNFVGRASTFTLRQQPTPIPEPAAIAVVGLALAGLSLRRRFR